MKPKQAACKALTGIYKHFKQNNTKAPNEIYFGVIEITRDSRHKTYWYCGQKVKLKEPVVLHLSDGKTMTYVYNNVVTKINTPEYAKKLNDVCENANSKQRFEYTINFHNQNKKNLCYSTIYCFVGSHDDAAKKCFPYIHNLSIGDNDFAPIYFNVCLTIDNTNKPPGYLHWYKGTKVKSVNICVSNVSNVDDFDVIEHEYINNIEEVKTDDIPDIVSFFDSLEWNSNDVETIDD